MNEFKGARVVKQYSHTVSARPSDVFPLLCPVREYDWIPGWNCRMVYSESGFAENNCIFRTDFPRGFEEIFVVSRYEPTNAIEFVIVSPEAYVMKMDIALRAAENGATELLWTHTLTGLTETGNAFIENYNDEAYAKMMERLSGVLEHFCKTGKMVKHTGFLGALSSALHGH
jgi:hypothetical protein